MRFFPKRKTLKIEVGRVIGIIEPTNIALENGVSDNFNKIIRLRSGVKVEGENIIWGKTIEEIPFSEETLYALHEIKQIPIVERKFNEPTFLEDITFGGIDL